MAITRFRDENYYLSSMYPLHHGVMTEDGHLVRSVEVGYQADKWKNYPEIRRRFLGMRSGYEAKRESKKIEVVGSDVAEDLLINEKKLKSMRWYVAQKFTRNEGIARRLIETGDEMIVEGNHWGDDFFGACTDGEGRLIGGNNLGLILMEARGLLQQEQTLMALNQKLGQIVVAQSRDWSEHTGYFPGVA